jgi:hypothetical protein
LISKARLAIGIEVKVEVDEVVEVVEVVEVEIDVNVDGIDE